MCVDVGNAVCGRNTHDEVMGTVSKGLGVLGVCLVGDAFAAAAVWAGGGGMSLVAVSYFILRLVQAWPFQCAAGHSGNVLVCCILLLNRPEGYHTTIIYEGNAYN